MCIEQFEKTNKKVIPLLSFLGDLRKFLDPGMIVFEIHKHFEKRKRYWTLTHQEYASLTEESIQIHPILAFLCSLEPSFLKMQVLFNWPLFFTGGKEASRIITKQCIYVDLESSILIKSPRCPWYCHLHIIKYVCMVNSDNFLISILCVEIDCYWYIFKKRTDKMLNIDKSGICLTIRRNSILNWSVLWWVAK